MPTELPFDIIALIVDIVGESKDTDLLKELALVSHSFLQICSNHLFAIIELHSANSLFASSSSKKGFVKLLKDRPEVVKYIRELKYNVLLYNDDDDHLLSPILLNFLPTFSRLNSLTITSISQDWNRMNPSLTSAFLHIMHLPTINHIDLSYIQNFPLFSLAQSVNLLQLDIHNLYRSHWHLLEEDASPEIVADMMPKIRKFYTSGSSRLTMKLLHAKTRDGLPAFNFMDLRRFSIYIGGFEDEQNIRYLLQKAKLLENLRLSVARAQSLEGLLSPGARNIKDLDLSVFLWDGSSIFLGGTCEELEALAGQNMLEAFKLRVGIDSDDTISTEGFIGSIFQKVENILVKPGWSALRRVSFKVLTSGWNKGNATRLCEALQSLPDKYLSHFSKLESVTFNYEACPPNCP